MKSKLWKSNYFIDNFLFPMGILILYFLSYWQIVQRVLAGGVNVVFAQRMTKYVLIGTVIISVAYFVILKLKGKKVEKFEYKYSIKGVHAASLLLVLLPLTPVIQYIGTNYSMMSEKEAVIIFTFFLLFSAIFIYIIPTLVGHSGSTRTLVAMGAAFTLMVTGMPLLSQQNSWYEYGSILVQFPIFAGVFLGVWILYKKNYRVILYCLVGLLFVGNLVMQYSGIAKKSEGSETDGKSGELIELVSGKDVKQTPNIYLLIYDAYAPTEVMQQYGIDNSGQETYLEELGFKIYPQVYSLGSRSSLSMNRVLDLTNNDDENSRIGMSGNGSVQKLLENIGYKTYGIFVSGYEFRGTTSSYDQAYPSQVTPISVQIISGILIGEFRFDLSFMEITHDEYVAEKQDALKTLSSEQAFLYSHTNLPNHSQISGKCLSNETALYAERLQQANTEMREDLEILLAHDPGAIIIIAGDHGPYLTKNCYKTEVGGYDISEITRLDILDRYGTFLAIKWPDKEFEKYDDISILQDIFPSVFAYMYQDEILLQARMDEIIEPNPEISGVSIENGIIHGGVNDGEPLFLPNND